MGRLAAVAMATLVVASSWGSAGSAHADEDDVLDAVCSADLAMSLQLQPLVMLTAPLRYEPVPLDQVPGFSFDPEPGDGWGQLAFVDQPVALQEKDGGDAAGARILVTALKSKDPAVLRELSEEGRARARAAGGSGFFDVETLVDEEGGARSWLVRTRATEEFDGVLCAVDETVSRNVLFSRDGMAYAVSLSGRSFWRRCPYDPEPDLEAGDELEERIRDGAEVSEAG